MAVTPTLDHIVILVPYADLKAGPSWTTNNFTISPGGRHGDGKTENRLIIFPDGSYIEFIAFIDDNPEFKKGHWWGDKGHGIIDYAFTLKEGHTGFDEIRKALEANPDIPRSWLPGELKGGGRTNADGERIEWQVAFPHPSARGAAPFWCFDVTPRERRVSDSSELTSHPDQLLGVLDLGIYTKDDAAARGLQAYLASIPLEPLDAPLPKASHSFRTQTNRTLENLVVNFISVRKTGEKPRAPQLDGERNIVADLILGAAKGADAKAIGGDEIDVRVSPVH